MHKDEVDLFLNRSKNFLEAAQERFEKEDWDLTCFFSEQAIQLYLKATLLELGGEFPRTHSVRQLFANLSQFSDKTIEYDRKSLRFIEDSYFNAKYLDYTYEKEDALDALNIVKKLKKPIDQIRKDFRNRQEEK
jgi:HEPN domain-containing protein